MNFASIDDAERTLAAIDPKRFWIVRERRYGPSAARRGEERWYVHDEVARVAYNGPTLNDAMAKVLARSVR